MNVPSDSPVFLFFPAEGDSLRIGGAEFLGGGATPFPRVVRHPSEKGLHTIEQIAVPEFLKEFEVQQHLFRITNSFPKEEMYSLTD